jgi:succinoglycan biosynthesis transport protein ExoP
VGVLDRGPRVGELLMSPSDANFSSSAPNQISLRDILIVVFKRRRFIGIFAISVVSLVVSTVLLLPRKFEVTAILHVNRSRAEVAMAPTDSSQLIVSGSEQDLNAEIEVLKSRTLTQEVAERVFPLEAELRRKTRVDRVFDFVWSLVSPASKSDVDELVLELQRDVQIRANTNSNAIWISYETGDPEWATHVVRTLTETYLERRTEAFQSSQAVSFFEEQMKEAEVRLAALEEKLEGFAEGSSITIVRGPQGTDSLGPQKALLMESLSRMENELGNAEVELQEQQQQLISLRSRLAEEPERIPTASRNNITAASEEIEVALSELRLRRDELLQDFREDSRYVRDIDQQILLAEERLDRANSAASGVNRTESNPAYTQLKSELMRVETDLEGTRARVDTLRNQVRVNRQELAALNASAFEFDALRRNALAAEEDYLLYRKKFEEARISSAMDQEKIINVTVAQPALMPLRPVRRGIVRKFMLALFVGVFGGFAIAFAIDQYVDRSFTTAEDIERRLGIPHLASIPDNSLME